jgi:hypothetical protein
VDFRRDPLGIFLRARNDDNIRAFRGEFQRDGAPDAATRAGDNGDLIGKLAHKIFSATDETQIEHKFKATNFRDA